MNTRSLLSVNQVRTSFLHRFRSTPNLRSENSSRLLDPAEYLFDVLSECVRSNMVDYHFIVKRMLWFNLPILVDNQSSNSELFVEFMFHQLVPELLEGTMIIIKNNHLSDELMVGFEAKAAFAVFTGSSMCSFL